MPPSAAGLGRDGALPGFYSHPSLNMPGAAGPRCWCKAAKMVSPGMLARKSSVWCLAPGRPPSPFPGKGVWVGFCWHIVRCPSHHGSGDNKDRQEVAAPTILPDVPSSMRPFLQQKHRCFLPFLNLQLVGCAEWGLHIVGRNPHFTSFCTKFYLLAAWPLVPLPPFPQQTANSASLLNLLCLSAGVKQGTDLSPSLGKAFPAGGPLGKHAPGDVPGMAQELSPQPCGSMLPRHMSHVGDFASLPSKPVLRKVTSR